MPTTSLYAGREQSLVKHFILRNYLCDFAHKVGFFKDTITYVDCFAGPWNTRSDAFEDSSFAIALAELRKARDTLRRHGRPLRLRCFFLEKDPDKFTRLAQFAASVGDAEVCPLNKPLAEATGDILDFVRRGGRGSFPFLFIDPTGWSGLDLETIRPLLELDPGEVLINFMTDYIRRFVDSPKQETAASVDRFFGCPGMQGRLLAHDDPQDREDELFSSYAAQVQRAGRYDHTCVATILYPKVDRCFFHLVYATRNPAGVEVFKRAEEKAMGAMAQIRASVQQAQQVTRTGQPELFTAEQVRQAGRLEALRGRYLDRARAEVEALLSGGTPVSYDRAWSAAMRWPLVWDADVKGWLRQWQEAERVEVLGLQHKERVPKPGGGHQLAWREPPPRQLLLFGG